MWSIAQRAFQNQFAKMRPKSRLQDGDGTFPFRLPCTLPRSLYKLREKLIEIRVTFFRRKITFSRTFFSGGECGRPNIFKYLKMSQQIARELEIELIPSAGKVSSRLCKLSLFLSLGKNGITCVSEMFII